MGRGQCGEREGSVYSGTFVSSMAAMWWWMLHDIVVDSSWGM